MKQLNYNGDEMPEGGCVFNIIIFAVIVALLLLPIIL